MAEVGSAFVTIVPSAKGFGKKLDGEVGPDLDGSGRAGGKRFGAAMGKSAGGAFKTIMGPALALVGVAAVGSFLKGSIAEARESQKVGAQTAAVIKSTGGAAKVTAKQFGDLATAISLKTGIDDEQIQAGENMLATFTNIRNGAGKNNDIFTQATRAATDLAVATKTGPVAANVLLGKALNDPAKGLTRLQKIGVTFTDGQKKQVAQMVKVGDTAGAQKVILKELGKEFGGSAEAQATAGEKAAVAVGNLKEQIGTALLPVIDRVANFLTTRVVPAISTFITQLQNGTGAGGKVADAFKKVGDVLSTVFTFISNNKAVVATFVGVVIGLTAAFAALNLVLAINPFTLIVLGIAALAAGFVYAYQNSETFRGFIDGLWNNVLKPFASWLGSVLPGVLRTVGGAFLSMAEINVKVFHFLLDVVLNVFGAIVNGAAKAFGWVPGLGGKIKGAAKGFNEFKKTVDNALDGVEGKINEAQAGLDGLGKKHPKPKVTLNTGPSLAAAERINTKLIALDKQHAKPSVSITGVDGALNKLGNLGLRLSDIGSKAARIRIPGNANGTDNWRGGLTWVGEKGPELVNLAKGAQVIPNHKLGDIPSVGSPAGMGGGGSQRDLEAAVRRAVDGATIHIPGFGNTRLAAAGG